MSVYLDRSVQLNLLLKRAKEILSYQEARYVHIVGSSERGEDCPYARLAARHAADEVPMLRGLLEDICLLSGALLDSADPFLIPIEGAESV